MSEQQKPGDEPRAKKRKPQRYSAKRDKLLERVTKGDTIARASKLAGYNSRQAGHRALMSVYASASSVLLRMNITPDKWLGEIAKVAGVVEDPGELGKKEVHVRASLCQNEKTVKLYDPSVKLNACAHLHKAFYGNGTDIDGADGDPGSRGIVINLGFLEPARAEAILGKLTRYRADRFSASLPERAVDVAPGQ